MLCPYCKEEIADGAIKCKHCESMLNGQTSPQHIPAVSPHPAPAAPIWSSITSLALGVISVFKYIIGGYIYYDEALGYLALGGAAVVFGGISLAKKHRGKGMAIAGMITGILGFVLSVAFWVE